MNLNQIQRKLQRALLTKQFVTKIGTSQFYSADQNRMITMYSVSTPTLQYVRDKWKTIIDKNNVIVAGHTRYKAAKKLGINTVPVIIADDLTDEQIKAFRLADNKVAEQAEWDIDLLNEELEEIFDIDMTDSALRYWKKRKKLKRTATSL